MRISLILLLTCIICFSAGCAQYYYQEGKTFEQCKQDRLDCLNELKQRVDTLSQRPGDYEYKYIEECMKRKGYRLVTENELPLDVKRQDPDTSLRGQLYGHRKGIAGTVIPE